MTCRAIQMAACALALAVSTSARAGTLEIGAGAELDLGTGSLDLGCADLMVAGTLLAGTEGVTGARDVTIDPTGTLDGDSATLEVAGDWDKAGTFNAGTGTVALVDGCAVGSAVVSGDNSFANLSITTTSAKQVSFAAGSTQTVAGLLTMQGSPGNLLEIRSTLAGNVAFLVSTGGSSVNYVDVDDLDAQSGNPIPIGYNSVMGSNAPGWLFGVPVPLLGPLGLGVLVLTLFASGRRRLFRPRAEA